MESILPWKISRKWIMTLGMCQNFTLSINGNDAAGYSTQKLNFVSCQIGQNKIASTIFSPICNQTTRCLNRISRNIVDTVRFRLIWQFFINLCVYSRNSSRGITYYFVVLTRTFGSKMNRKLFYLNINEKFDWKLLFKIFKY